MTDFTSAILNFIVENKNIFDVGEIKKVYNHGYYEPLVIELYLYDEEKEIELRNLIKSL